MARKAKSTKQKPKKQGRRRFRFGAIALIAAAAIAVCAIGWMHLRASIVHVRYAEVTLADLPASFDGTTILFVSDFDLCGLNTSRRAARLIRRLQQLEPDILLFSGDCASASLLDRLNGSTGADERSARTALYECLGEFDAPLGKFAVLGDNDGDLASARLQAYDTGIELIDGKCAVVSNGTDAIAIVGVGAEPCNLTAVTSKLSTDKCVIVLLHSPSKIIDVRIAEAQGGGAWADLALAGHTHGGQMRIGSRTALELDDAEQRYIAGWYNDSSAPLLVSQGIGCEGANLRLGTQSEVWLITLRRDVGPWFQ